MVVAGGVRDLAVTREPRARQYSARPTGVAGAVNTLAAQRALKAVRTTALDMGEVGVAVSKVAPELREGNLVYASDTGAERGVKWKTVVRVLRAFPASASPTVVAVVASILTAQKVLKEALCFAKHMVGAKGAHF